MKSNLPVYRHLIFVFSIFSLTALSLAIVRRLEFSNLPLFEEIVLTSIVSTIFVFILLTSKLRSVSREDSVQTIAHICLIGFLLTMLVLPNSLLNIDRSRSFYVLNWVELNKVVEKNGKLELSVVSPEASDIAGVRMRVDEQVKRGLISRTQSGLEISRTGTIVLNLSQVIAAIFSLHNWEKNKF